VAPLGGRNRGLALIALGGLAISWPNETFISFAEFQGGCLSQQVGILPEYPAVICLGLVGRQAFVSGGWVLKNRRASFLSLAKRIHGVLRQKLGFMKGN